MGPLDSHYDRQSRYDDSSAAYQAAQQYAFAGDERIIIPSLRTGEDPNQYDRTVYPRELNLVDIYMENKESVVEINSVKSKVENGAIVKKDGMGTGFFVDSSGRLVTNYHVVEDAESLQVRTSDGKTYNVVIEDVEPASDLALLRVQAPGRNFKAAPLASDSDMYAGEQVVSLGHPRGWDPLFLSEGRYLRHRTLRELEETLVGGLLPGEDPNREIVHTEIHVQPGNSGGPLFDSYGKVVGVVGLTTSGSRADSTPVEQLHAFLNRNGVGVRPAQSFPMARPFSTSPGSSLSTSFMPYEESTSRYGSVHVRAFPGAGGRAVDSRLPYLPQGGRTDATTPQAAPGATDGVRYVNPFSAPVERAFCQAPDPMTKSAIYGLSGFAGAYALAAGKMHPVGGLFAAGTGAYDAITRDAAAFVDSLRSGNGVVSSSLRLGADALLVGGGLAAMSGSLAVPGALAVLGGAGIKLVDSVAQRGSYANCIQRPLGGLTIDLKRRAGSY